MAQNTANVAASKPASAAGAIFRAPVGTALPTDATTALDAEFVPLGYLSEDGIAPEREQGTENVLAFGGDVVEVLMTEDNKTFEFTLIEVFSSNVQKWIHGEDNVTVTPAVPGTSPEQITVVDVAHKPDDSVLVFELKHEGKRRRVVVHAANSTVSGEGAYVDGELSAYTVTAAALKDASGARVTEHLEAEPVAA